ncbi:hypothetical protein HBI88_100770 [Parastagonospora nodorum]|nr:hypothetical protein HBH61_138340 [Parastagonospora nodorum]KAH5074557.1 hypothetical protein HBH95_144250 [Parastagonospora nodorum]KAH5737330.1 hypothetical protein HBI18_065830 [Parastagonospora nodorum]KAH5788525.1 hypothetical protein HBI97_074730 [Parastagonospora nodorum]KAH5814360.1 hypothetical protein HBI96_072110 [Parastagonospora nodorum]
MDEVNDYIGNRRFTKLRPVQLHSVDGKTSLFPEVVSEEEATGAQDWGGSQATENPDTEAPVASEAPDESVADIKTAFGPAQVTKDANFTSIPAMVACSVKGNFGNLRTVSRFKLPSINTPELLFSDEEVREIKKYLKNKLPTCKETYQLPLIPIFPFDFTLDRDDAEQAEWMRQEVDGIPTGNFEPCEDIAVKVWTFTVPMDDHQGLAAYRFVHERTEDAVLGHRRQYRFTREVPEVGRGRHENIDRSHVGGPSRPRASSLPARASIRHLDPIDASTRKEQTHALTLLAEEHGKEYLLAQPGKAWHTPTTRDLLRVYYRLQIGNPLFSKGMKNSLIPIFRRICAYSHHWMVSERKINAIFIKAHAVWSTGLIPLHEKDREHMDELLEEFGLDADLPALKTNDVAEKAPGRDKAQAKVETKAKAKRSFKPVSKLNVHEQLREKAKVKFAQKDSIDVVVHFREDARIKSEICMQFTFNYLDDDVPPPKQPRHVAEVTLTHRNARAPGDVPAEDGYTIDHYADSHQVIDVTHPMFNRLLCTLYPNAVVQDPAYFDALRNSVADSGHKLYLITQPMNEMPFSANVLTLRDDMPAAHQDLAIMIQNSPHWYILVRGSDFDTKVQRIIDQFCVLAHWDPLSEFFINPHQRYLNNKSITTTMHLPKFITPAQFAFENYMEFETHAAISQILECRSTYGEFKYTGKAAVVPVPHSWNTERKVYMVYALVVTIDKASKHLPALLEGQALHVDFSMDTNISGAAWFGKVMPATAATVMGAVTMYVHRPQNDDGLADTTEHATLTVSKLNNMDPATVQRWVRQQGTHIIISVKNEDKEMKRYAHGFANMHIPKQHRIKQPFKDKRLSDDRQMLTCNNHRNYEVSSLHDDAVICDPLLPQALHFLEENLLSHQKTILAHWQDKVYNRFLALGGPSGGGKTTLAILISLPYLLTIRLSMEEVEAMHKDSVDYETIIEDARARRAGEAKPEEDNDAFGDNAWGAPTEDASPEKKKKKGKKTKPQLTDEEMAELHMKRSTFIERNGTVTLCAMQNSTVDAQFLAYSRQVEKFESALKLAPLLGFRAYAEHTELNAVVAMLEPDYSFEKVSDVYFLSAVDPEYLGSVSQSVLATYAKAIQGSEFEGIHDARFVFIKTSMAYNIMMLAEVPGFPKSAALIATFSATELADIAQESSDLRDAQRDLITEGAMSKDIASKAKKGAKQIIKHLLEKAAYIVTTLAIATTSSFNAYRQSSVIMLEEAGRPNDAGTIGIFAHFWSAKLRLVSGDWKQLPPAMFGRELDNPFQAQGCLSLLARLFGTGFDVPRLNHSSRFKNELLLQVCRIVNEEPTLQPVEGSFDDKSTEQASLRHYRVHGIHSPVVFLNVTETETQSTSSKSAYNVECAVVAMRCLEEHLRYTPGSALAYLTPYNAQITVMQAMIRQAAMEAKSAKKPALAKQWMAVTLTTIDSFMGEDVEHTIVDLGEHIGFAFDKPRFLVAHTRARLSAEYIGDSRKFTGATSKIKSSHPVRKLIQLLHEERCIKMVDPKMRYKYARYHAALEGLGLQGDKDSKSRHAPDFSALGIAHVPKSRSWDDSDSDDSDTMPDTIEGQRLYDLLRQTQKDIRVTDTEAKSDDGLDDNLPEFGSDKADNEDTTLDWGGWNGGEDEVLQDESTFIEDAGEDEVLQDESTFIEDAGEDEVLQDESTFIDDAGEDEVLQDETLYKDPTPPSSPKPTALGLIDNLTEEEEDDDEDDDTNENEDDGTWQGGD